MTTHLWNWDGAYFGYRDGEHLWTFSGVLAGTFHGGDIFGTNGHYLGEIRDGDRLVANISKASARASGFGSRQGAAVANRGAVGGRGMVAGFKEFPKAETFR